MFWYAYYLYTFTYFCKLQFPEIVAVHEFHVWQLTGSRIVASLHVMFSASSDYNLLATSMKEFFHKEGIHSTTVQPEFIEVKNLTTNFIKNCIKQI